MTHEPFTHEQDHIIREVYPRYGSPGVLKILTGFNRQQVCGRANKLGVIRDKDWQNRVARLKCNETSDPFGAGEHPIADDITHEQDHIIREVYPRYGALGVLKILTGFNRQQVCFRAYELGVIRDKKWQNRLARLKRNETSDPFDAGGHPVTDDIYPDAIQRLAYARAWG